MSLPEPTKQPDDLATLLHDIELQRQQYPNDTVLKLMQRLAVQLQHHTWDGSHVRTIGGNQPPQTIPLAQAQPGTYPDKGLAGEKFNDHPGDPW